MKRINIAQYHAKIALNCLRTPDTNPLCERNVRRNGDKDGKREYDPCAGGIR